MFDHYLAGMTIARTVRQIPDLDAADDRVRGRIERAVLRLLGGKTP